MASKKYAFLITRSDHDHHTDKKGRLCPVSIYTTKDDANAAAKAYLISESTRTRGVGDPELYHLEDKHGFYMGDCVCYEDRRHEFRVRVKKMELCGAADVDTSGVAADAVEKTKGKRRVDEGDGSAKKKSKKSDS